MVQLAQREYCTGCGVCSAVCPTEAVTMQQGEADGFYRPVMEADKCINCGKCESVCPKFHGHEETQRCAKVYAAVNKDKKVRNASASGGLFGTFAAEVIRRGGCVAGVAYDENLTVVHSLAQEAEELQPLLGSKYAQSDTRYIYTEVGKALAAGRNVMFCGTPCQVAAMKSFAEKKGLDDKLVTIDLLCRGVPSPKAFHKYLEMLEKRTGKKVVSVKFKDNERGWHNINNRIIMSDGTECYLPLAKFTYGDGFLRDNIIVRESCFHCAYKNINRLGDITIGDFWGLKNTRLEDDKGTSVVILNSDKGIRLWEDVKGSLEYKESTMWRVIKGNRKAFSKLPENPVRERFWMYLAEKDFDEALAKARQI